MTPDSKQVLADAPAGASGSHLYGGGCVVAALSLGSVSFEMKATEEGAQAEQRPWIHPGARGDHLHPCPSQCLLHPLPLGPAKPWEEAEVQFLMDELALPPSEQQAGS